MIARGATTSYPVSLLAVVPRGDELALAFVTWLGRDALGLSGLAADAGPSDIREVELRLPDGWGVEPLKLNVTPIAHAGAETTLAIGPREGLSLERYAQLFRMAGAVALRAATGAADSADLPRPSGHERRASRRYPVRGLGARLTPAGEPWEIADISEGGFAVCADLPARPAQVFELVGDERWRMPSIWVNAQVVRPAQVSGVRLVRASAANYQRYLAVVRLARGRP